MSSETSAIKGSCFCKGIQYEVLSGTAQWITCYCSMCRKMIGADFGTFFAVPKSKLQMKAKETLKSYRSSKDAVRSFCSTCGCSVMMESDFETNTIWFNPGTLDHEIPVIKPSQIFTEDKAFWMDIMREAPHSGDISNWEVDCAKDL
ncbi:uncharacterized protein [Palaemon carinicauda]|uniref:uncharacterized protein n=1 Tax=Palaemon carinicauda TaxID=392227 RepID=UPI0035B67B23